MITSLPAKSARQDQEHGSGGRDFESRPQLAASNLVGTGPSGLIASGSHLKDGVKSHRIKKAASRISLTHSPGHRKMTSYLIDVLISSGAFVVYAMEERH